MPGPVVIVVVALAWGFVYLLLRSEPGSEFTPGILWLLFTASLALLWLATTVWQAQQTWKSPGLRKTARMVGYMIPFPAAVIVLFAVIPGDLPLKTRFGLSEEALTRHVVEFERTGGESSAAIQMVGLYHVGSPGRRDGCVTVTTNSDLDYYAGFAYCTGPVPTEPNVDFNHIKGRWWKFEVYH
jgi:hypothetical protein